jgi:hypothetical protein
MIQGAIVADDRGLTDHNAHPVVDKKTSPNACTWMNLDTSEPSRDARYPASEPSKPHIPNPMRQPMHKHCMETGVACDDLPRTSCCGISIKNDADFFFYTRKHYFSG